MDNVIGENIRRLREARGMKRFHLAKALSTGAINVAHWEDGEVIPSAYSLGIIADLFGVSVDEVMGRGETTIVVRCKNCRHREWKTMFGSTVILECGLTERTKKPEDFCSEGIPDDEQGGQDG